MKKLIYTLLLLPFILFAAASCEPFENGYGLDNPEQYSKVYIAASFNGLKELEVAAPKEDTIEVYANYGGVVPLANDLTVNVAADLSLVSSYNTANKTSFKVMPTATFELSPSSAVIKAGASTSEIPALIRLKTIAFTDDATYLLPIKISSLSDPTIQINSNLSVLYMAIRCTASAMYVSFDPLKDFVVDANEKW